jgi:hypothetical protein
MVGNPIYDAFQRGLLTMTFQEKKKAILEGIVISGLIAVGIISFIRGDYTNGAWALGLAGGYAFKNGVAKT